MRTLLVLAAGAALALIADAVIGFVMADHRARADLFPGEARGAAARSV